MASDNETKLKKQLKLFDVYAISTGAMFSSGFFLLPGLAALQTGPSVALAYLIAGVMMLPAMLSIAELSTAMPRAGGAYFFLDRAMGPMMGTVTGVGAYMALTLKSAFALVGMGAYVALFFDDLSIQLIAVLLTLGFMVLNIVGAKETTSLQRALIVILLATLAVFLVSGVVAMGDLGLNTIVDDQFTPFFTDGLPGLLATVGFVFVSYAGLTKVTSVAEEVENPGRNIPLGMILSIVTATIIYVLGVIIMQALLSDDVFHTSLTPVADTAEVAMDWLPGAMGVLIVVLSAVAAFASTGNAGVMAASRFPLAMGRDRLLPDRFARLTGAKRTPVFSIVFTASLMIAAIVFMDESSIAKVASTFQLLLFMLINLAVIVMRESKIEYYDPVFHSPLYPWMQFGGVAASIFLISFIGTDAVVLTMLVIVASVLWYVYYANGRVARHGAIYHLFERLGRLRYEGLEAELREIVKEKGLRDEDPFDEVVTQAHVIDLGRVTSLEEINAMAAAYVTQKYPLITQEQAEASFMESLGNNYTLVPYSASIPHLRHESIDHTEMVIVRTAEGIWLDHDSDESTEKVPVTAFFFVVSPESKTGQHLRIMAQLASRIEVEGFRHDWSCAQDEQELKEILLASDRLLTLWISSGSRTQSLIGRSLQELRLPEGTLVALVRRAGSVIVPRGSTTLSDGDRITIIGEPDAVKALYTTYVGDQPQRQAVDS